VLSELSNDPDLSPFVMRALGDFGMDLVTQGKPGLAPVDLLKTGLNSSDPRTRLEAIVSTVRQNRAELANEIAKSLGHADPRLLMLLIGQLKPWALINPALGVLNNPSSSSSQRKGASFALMRIHLRSG